MKKRKNRAHSPLKRMQRFLAGNIRLYRWESDFDVTEQDDTGQIILESRKTPMLKNYVPLQHHMLQPTVMYPMDWMLCCRALCCADLAKPNEYYIETEIRAFNNMALTHFSSEYFNMRAAVMQAVNTRHVIDVGWIAHTRHPRINLDGEWYRGGEGEISDGRRMLWNYSQKLEKGRIAQVEEAA